MSTAIKGSVNRVSIPVIIDGEEIAVVRINPHNPLIMRNIAHVVKLLKKGFPEWSETVKNDADISDELPACESSDTSNENDIKKIVEIADFIDDVIDACDKVFGCKISELILSNDDSEMSLLKQLFSVVADEVYKSRQSLSDKYKA